MNIVLMEPLGIAQETLSSLMDTLHGHQFTALPERIMEKSSLLLEIQNSDVLMLANQPLPEDVLQLCPQVKMISVAFTGVDHIPLKYCKEHGIAVSNAAGYATQAVTELVFGLTLSLYRKLIPCDLATRNGLTGGHLMGREISGKTFGIIGTGAIGLRVAEVAKAFGCNVLAYSRTEKQQALDLGVKYCSMEEVLQKSDILTVHVPATDNTIGMIGERELSVMKPSAILINTARGAIVDHIALANALQSGTIAGAGIDVFSQEPPLPKEEPLLQCDNAILTPHIGYASQEALQMRAEIAFQNVISWLDGAPQNQM